MRRLFFILLLTTAQACTANELILSQDVLLEYDPPPRLVHTPMGLTFHYADDQWVSHDLPTAETYYPGFDFEDDFRPFLRAIFDPSLRADLPEDVASKAEEQARVFGVSNDNTVTGKVGEAELIGVYADQQSRGHLYLLEARTVHHFEINGSKADFRRVINNLRERE